MVLLDWTSPLTNKVLIEASGIHRVERWGNMHLQTKGLDPRPGMIAVTEQGATCRIGAVPQLPRPVARRYNNSWNNNFHYRFNVSYITGSHAFKVGMNNAHGYHENLSYRPTSLAYRFNNGVPNQLTMRALPHTHKNNVDQDLGIFAQDKWTINRADRRPRHPLRLLREQLPGADLGPTRFTPARNLTFPAHEI